MKIALTLTFFIFLSGCDLITWQPDMRDKIPSSIPIKKRLYSNARLTECAINIFELEKVDFDKQNFTDDPSWQSTPIQGKIYDMSKAAASIAFSHNCLKGQKDYQKMVNQYDTEQGAYFKTIDGDGLVLLYVPENNILLVIDWD